MIRTFFIILFSSILYTSCTVGQSQSEYNLSASDFSAKMEELPAAPLIDVRTPGEYANGHIQNALNYNWNGSDFEIQISTLDKSKPVFVYCLSGGRSAQAVHQMRSEGFTQVYELNGGIMKWRAADLPETNANTDQSTGMSIGDFHNKITSDKLVLIDFYADWCAPCKKMKPYLDEIAKDMADTVVLVRIDADKNEELCKELKVDALPVLQLYENKSLVWENTGYIGKQEVLNQIR